MLSNLVATKITTLLLTQTDLMPTSPHAAVEQHVDGSLLWMGLGTLSTSLC